MLKVKHYIILGAIFLVAGCTDNGLLFRSGGGYETTETQGVYKLGDSYEIDGVTYTPAVDTAYNETGYAGWYADDDTHLITANGERYDADLMTGMHKTLPLPTMVKMTNLETGKTAVVRINDRGPFVNDRLVDVSEKTARTLGFNMDGLNPVRVEVLPLNQQLGTQGKIMQTRIETPQERVDNLTALYNDPLSRANVAAKTVKPATVSVKNDVIYAPKKAAPKKRVARPVAATGDYYIQIGVFSRPENVHQIQSNLGAYHNLTITDLKRGNRTLQRVRIGPFSNRELAVKVLDNTTKAGYPDATLVQE